MKIETLTLSAPDFSAIDTLARRTDPAVLWPVGPQALAAHWLDHAVRLGCRRVVIHAADRPALIREELAGGAYWSLEIEVSTDPAPADAVALLRLPNDPQRPAPQTAADLLEWWLQLNLRWLASRNPGAVSIDRYREDGGWIAPRATVHPSATLTAPYWIGAGTEIGPDCRIGPHAVVGAGCLLERDVRLENSLVLPGTFLGSHLDVDGKIFAGATLLDPGTGTRVDITDPFIASLLASPTRPDESRLAKIFRGLWRSSPVSAS